MNTHEDIRMGVCEGAKNADFENYNDFARDN